jgi:hypothetical protein
MRSCVQECIMQHAHTVTQECHLNTQDTCWSTLFGWLLLSETDRFEGDLPMAALSSDEGPLLFPGAPITFLHQQYVQRTLQVMQTMNKNFLLSNGSKRLEDLGEWVVLKCHRAGCPTCNNILPMCTNTHAVGCG